MRKRWLFIPGDPPHHLVNGTVGLSRGVGAKSLPTASQRVQRSRDNADGTEAPWEIGLARQTHRDRQRRSLLSSAEQAAAVAASLLPVRALHRLLLPSAYRRGRLIKSGSGGPAEIAQPETRSQSQAGESASQRGAAAAADSCS